MGDSIVLQLIFKTVCDLALDLVALGILVTLTVTPTKFVSVYVLAQVRRIDVNDETMRKLFHMMTITSLLYKSHS